MATAAPSLSSNCVHLNWSDEDGSVVVTPSDKDRFIIKLSRAIEALKQVNKEDQFQRQLDLLLRVLAKWLRGRNDIRQAYVTLRDGALAFVVVRKLAEYDEASEDELSDLDIAVAMDVDLDLIKMDALSLPDVSNEALASFLDPNFVLTYDYGNRSGSSSAGE